VYPQIVAALASAAEKQAAVQFVSCSISRPMGK
jgi:hypothetical protein